MSNNIKLVIEIPKIDKELLDTGRCGETRKEAILYAVKNGNPLSEVLNEIKGEVEIIQDYVKGLSDSTDCAIRCIDKHIGKGS